MGTDFFGAFDLRVERAARLVARPRRRVRPRACRSTGRGRRASRRACQRAGAGGVPRAGGACPRRLFRVRPRGVPRGTSDAGALRQRAPRLHGRGAARRHRRASPRRRARSRAAAARSSPATEAVSGFVFKVQANMDPNHRDRIAFLRLCSGRLPPRHEAQPRRAPARRSTIHSPMLFFGQERADRRRRGGRRRDRHSQPRHAARRRYAGRGARHPLHRPAGLRAGSAAPRAAWRYRQGEAGAPGAGGSCRGGAGAGVPAADRRALDRRRGRRSCSSTC